MFRCSIVECLEAASLHPASALGLEASKGTLNFGADADLVILDLDSLAVKSTWIGTIKGDAKNVLYSNFQRQK